MIDGKELKEIKVNGVKYYDSSIVYEVEGIIRPKCTCKNCSHDYMPQRHSTSHYKLRDETVEGKTVYIDLIRRRYKCPECHNVFKDKFDFFIEGKHYTKRLQKEVSDRYHNEYISIFKLGKEYGFDCKTIKDMIFSITP